MNIPKNILEWDHIVGKRVDQITSDIFDWQMENLQCGGWKDEVLSFILTHLFWNRKGHYRRAYHYYYDQNCELSYQLRQAKREARSREHREHSERK
jgi:hypothetical protein